MRYIILFFILATSLFADTTLKFKSGSADALKFYYADDAHMRLTMYDDDGSSDLYVIGKKSYIVSHDNGRYEIVDLDQMRAMMGALGAMVQEEMIMPLIEVVKRGSSTTVAGVRGEKWTIRMRENEHERSETMKVVVTDNPQVLNAMRKLTSAFSLMPSGEASMMSFFEIQKGYVMIKHVDLELVKYSDRSIDPSVFVLPNKQKRVSQPKAEPRKKTITKERRIKKCKRFASADNDGSSGSMKYGSPKCVEWYYEVETYEVEVEDKGRSGYQDNHYDDDNDELGSDNPMDALKSFF